MLDASAAIFGLRSAEEFAGQHLLDRLLEPAEPAALIAWLCGPRVGRHRRRRRRRRRHDDLVDWPYVHPSARPWPLGLDMVVDDHDARMHAPGPDRGRRAADARGVWRVPEGGRDVGPPQALPLVRRRELLRLLPARHATAHFHRSGHPLVQSFEPGEDWVWCYVDELAMEPE